MARKTQASRPQPRQLERVTLKDGRVAYRWLRPILDDLGNRIRWELDSSEEAGL